VGAVTQTRWLEGEEYRAWYAVIAMHDRLTARLNRRLQEEWGLSLADFDVLSRLAGHPGGRARNYELAGVLQWEKSRLSHHLTRMQRRGLIAREDCPEDGRGAVVRLTEEGRRAVEQAGPGHAAAVRHFLFDRLGPAHVTALREAAESVLAHLDQPPAPSPGPRETA
jgi:DNA-binding MarR family transcriptional regulator